MKTKLLLEIAITLLRARLKQTLVAALGVTFGITMFIALLSFMNGLNDLLDGLVLNRTPHVRLYNEIEPNKNQAVYLAQDHKHDYNFISSIKAGNSRQAIYNATKIIRNLEQDPRVLGISRKVAAQVFFNDGAVDITGVMNGIEVGQEIRFYKFGDYVTQGNPTDIKNLSNSIILGKPLARKLLANLGDVIQITTSAGERFPLKVVGFYESGLAEFDKTQSFAAINTVQKILGNSDSYVTDIQVKLLDMNQAPAVAKEYAAIFETNAEDIQTANAQFETGTRVRNIISYAVGITLLIVAGFGIYNILNMMIYEKMDTIAILKATGFAGIDVKRIFIFISLSIGFFGCLLGLILGNGLTHVINHIPFHPPAIPTVKTFPVAYHPLFYLIAIFFSFLTTYFAGWFPARKASKVDPVIIIRGK